MNYVLKMLQFFPVLGLVLIHAPWLDFVVRLSLDVHVRVFLHQNRNDSGPKVMNSCSTELSMKFVLLINTQMHCFSILDILIFNTKINVILSPVEQEMNRSLNC